MVEALHRLDESDVSFIDEIQKRDTPVLVLLGH